MPTPLKPQATAVWLVDNTTLTFEQIAHFCALHPLEVQSIADGEVAVGIIGEDPVKAGEVTPEELERCIQDPEARLELSRTEPAEEKKVTRYVPGTLRRERPGAILWLLRNHPELRYAQIARLVGSTRPTIESVRKGTHWNAAAIKPVDPITLGLCKQAQLDAEVAKAARRLERERKKLSLESRSQE